MSNKLLIYNTNYIFTKKVGKGSTQSLLEDMSELVGIPINTQGLKCLLGNLFLCIKNNYTAMKLSSDNTFYSKGVIAYDRKVKTNVTRKDASIFKNALISNWQCTHQKGSNLMKLEGEYNGGYIEISEDLFQEIYDMDYNSLIEEVESMKIENAEVSLKKFKNVRAQVREEVTFKPDEKVKLMREVIYRYNDFISKHNIRLNGVKLDCSTYRLFLDDTEHYGRFHSQYQTIPSLDRSRILIDGESVVEVDIVSSHPSILLSEVGIDPCEVTIYNFIKVNEKLKEVYGDDSPMLDRSSIKPFILLAINCDSKIGCIRALVEKPELRELFGTKHEVYNLILDELEEWLSPIKHKFYTGDGLRLMKVESDIVFTAMDALTQASIPTLFVHDSFICKLSDLHELVYWLEVAMLSNVSHELKLDIKKPKD